MTTFGRKPITKVAVPNNRLMTVRANRQLEGYAAAKSEHFENSLGVDAPLFYFWHKDSGSIPCSCVASRISANRDIEIGGTNKSLTVRDDKRALKIKLPEYGSSTVQDIYGTPQETRPATAKEKYNTETYDDPLSGHDDDINDIEDIGDEANGITDFKDPLNLFGDKVTYCPVCYGAGYIDAWNIHGGKRYVFDTSNAYHFSCVGVDIQTEQSPSKLVALTKDKSACYWRFKLPLVWNEILRIAVMRGTELVAPYLYSWVFKDSVNNIIDLTIDKLNEYNNTGDTISVEIVFKEVGIEFTHAEIIFAFQEPKRAQIPELQQGYEQEFLDWNVNLSVELPPDLVISEGDYLTESKYQKIWKVSALTKRVTAGGVIFGQTAELRALHSFEMSHSSMSIFSTDYYKGITPR